MKKTASFLILFTLCGNSFAEVQNYESTDNTGLNKKERIDSVEKYLSDLSLSLKSMESKFDENSKKMKVLEDTVKKLTEKNEPKLNSPTGDLTEVEKIKNEIQTLKTKDIEKIKNEVEELGQKVKAIQSTIRSQI